jgi:hypothetical protein
MFSFLGDLFSLMLGSLLGFPRRIVEELDLSMDGCVEFFRVWLNESHDPQQQMIASARSSVGPPGDWLALVRTYLRPARLARVRVRAHHSIR